MSNLIDRIYVVYETNYEDSRNHGVFREYSVAQNYVKKWVASNPKNNFECNMDIEEWILNAQD
jgi:hypothetical protein